MCWPSEPCLLQWVCSPLCALLVHLWQGKDAVTKIIIDKDQTITAKRDTVLRRNADRQYLTLADGCALV